MKTGVFPDIFFPSPEFKGAEFFSHRPNFMATLASALVASQESSSNFPGWRLYITFPCQEKNTPAVT
jgi:hypothetical protein